MNQANTSPCLASYASSRAYPQTARSEVMSAVACPVCSRPVRLKLMGSAKFPGRYVGISKHVAQTNEQRVAEANAKTNAAMTPKERAASDRIVAALAKPSHQPTTEG